METEAERVTKVTLELADGTIQTFAIHENDGVACFMVSKEQDFDRRVGYCGSLSTVGLVLLDNMVKAAKVLESIIRTEQVAKELERYKKLHQN